MLPRLMVVSLSLLPSFFWHAKIVIPNSMPPFSCLAKRRRFSFMENTSFISTDFSFRCKPILEPPEEKEENKYSLIMCSYQYVSASVYVNGLDCSLETLGGYIFSLMTQVWIYKK